MTLYRIRDWGSRYENNRSKTMIDARWVPIPNKHDGEGYLRIMGEKDGLEIFACWVLLLQLASRCQPRGTLAKDNGTPMRIATMSLRTRVLPAKFERALTFLTNIDWIESLPFDNEVNAGDCQLTATQLTGGRQEGAQKEGMEGNGRKPAVPLDYFERLIPEILNQPAFLILWRDWVDDRKARKKPMTEIAAKLQLNEMAEWGIEKAIQAINTSIKAGYQGIFEPSIHANRSKIRARSAI